MRPLLEIDAAIINTQKKIFNLIFTLFVVESGTCAPFISIKIFLNYSLNKYPASILIAIVYHA